MSQTCNLYNQSLDRVPVFEVVGAALLDSCSSAKTSGHDPRVLHVQAQDVNGNGTISLSVNIQVRKWLPRPFLSDIPKPQYAVVDPPRPDWSSKPTWLDNLSGWIARGYTRVALPDEFNTALENSKLKTVLEDKVPKDKGDIYGIYLSIQQDSEKLWEDALGLMPPPYNLEIVIIVQDDQLRIPLKERVVKQIFEDKVEDPENRGGKITRAELARRYQLRLSRHGIHVRGMAEIDLQELRQLVRYSMVDHLSNSEFSALE
ncbi:MAG: hypothetical protein WCA85_04635 [Paraburkholderia sp.]|uniref:hypothetical protein n=1 Tax=Paraburkholderia sp. TaxID=1926495 RepID=UPI003C6A6584